MSIKMKTVLLKLLSLVCIIVLAIAGGVMITACGGANDSPVAKQSEGKLSKGVKTVNGKTEFIYTVNRSGAQDSNQRYYSYIQFEPASVDTNVSFEIPFKVTKNGKAAGTVHFYLLTAHFDNTDCMLQFSYGDLPGNTAMQAANITDEYKITLEQGTEFSHGGVNYIVATEDTTWYFSGETAAMDRGSVAFAFYNEAAAQDSVGSLFNKQELRRYMTSGTSSVDLLALGIDTPLIPMLVSKNGGAPTTKSFRIWNNSNGTFNKDYLVATFEYARLYDYADVESPATDISAKDIKDVFVISMEKGTKIIQNGNLVTVANDICWYMTEDIILSTEGDRNAFTTKTSLALSYEENGTGVSEVKLRFGAIISEGFYNKLNSLMNDAKNKTGLEKVNTARIDFGILINDGSERKVEWKADGNFSVATLTKVDENGKEDANGKYYLFLAVIDGLEGKWDQTITAQAYLHLTVDAATGSSYDKDDDYFFKATTYSVNTLAKKYKDMNLYSDSAETLNRLINDKGVA